MNNKKLPAMPLRGVDGALFHHNEITGQHCEGFTKEEVVFKDILCAAIQSGEYPTKQDCITTAIEFKELYFTHLETKQNG